MITNAIDLFAHKCNHLRNNININNFLDAFSLANILRSLLTDKHPLLHEANKTYHKKFIFKINSLKDIDIPSIDSAFHFHDISSAPYDKELNLSCFLKTIILTSGGVSITVKDLITHISNKSGAIHYNPENSNLEEILDKLESYSHFIGISAISYLLRSITIVFLRGTQDLYDDIVKIPLDISLIAHYKIESGSIRFKNRHFLETNDFNVFWDTAFSWSSFIHIITDKYEKKGIIYEAGSIETKNPKFTIGICPKDGLFCSFNIESQLLLSTNYANYWNSKYSRNWIFLNCQICIINNSIKLRIMINNIELSSSSIINTHNDFFFNKQTIGSNIKGNNGASFEAKEFIISNTCLDLDKTTRLAKYFWLSNKSM